MTDVSSGKTRIVMLVTLLLSSPELCTCAILVQRRRLVNIKSKQEEREDEIEEKADSEAQTVKQKRKKKLRMKLKNILIYR